MEKKKTQKTNKGPGQPTKLTKTLSLRIRRMYLSGKDHDTIREELEIKKGTWDHWYWNDTQSFRSNFVLWRREKMLNQAEKNLEQFVEMPTEIEDIEDSDEENGPRSVVVTDPRLVKIKLDATTYLTDTIGKDTYSKRVIQEDPTAAKSSEVDELRKSIKKIMTNQRSRHLSVHFKDKMAKAVK
jgi:hypothetical protein